MLVRETGGLTHIHACADSYWLCQEQNWFGVKTSPAYLSLPQYLKCLKLGKKEYTNFDPVIVMAW